MQIEKIGIVGGGLSGWLTAYWMKKHLPNFEISVFASQEVDNLGTGEGGLPILLHFFKICEIDLHDFFKKTGATIKLGVNFINWNNDDKNYYHPFTGSLIQLDEIIWPERTEEEKEIYKNDSEINEEEIIHEQVLNDYYNFLFQNDKFKEGAIPFGEKIPNLVLEEIFPKLSRDGMSGISFHFDAAKTANYFKELAINLGILYHEKHVIDTEIDVDQNTTTLITVKTLDNLDYEYHDVDFVFDCSGFSRVVMSQYSNIESMTGPVYVPYEYLTTNSAIPFILDEQSDQAWTNAISMKYGWMWQIPLQHRKGCGYVFDDRYCTEQEAIAEIEEYLSQKITPLKCIKFQSGYLDQPWFGNVIALGLSQSFLEPMEATSLGFLVTQLYEVIRIFREIQQRSLEDNEENLDLESLEEWNMLDLDDEVVFDRRLQYNNLMNDTSNELANFVYLHFITKRNDTDFWKDKNDQIEIYNAEDLEFYFDRHDYNDNSISIRLTTWFNNSFFYRADRPEVTFLNLYNWLCIIDGIEFYNRKDRNENLQKLGITSNMSIEQGNQLIEHFVDKKNALNENNLSQRKYLEKYGLVYTL